MAAEAKPVEERRPAHKLHVLAVARPPSFHRKSFRVVNPPACRAAQVTHASLVLPDLLLEARGVGLLLSRLRSRRVA